MPLKFTITKNKIIAALLFIAVLSGLVIYISHNKDTDSDASESSSVTAAASISETNETTVTTSPSLSITTTVKKSSSSTSTTTTTAFYISEPECSAAALYCIDDKEMLYSDRINERIAPASITKLLTAATALQYADLDTVFTVGNEQSLVQPNSSLCGLEVGDKLTLRDLITGMLMSSGNDAAYTIAVSISDQITGYDMYEVEAVDYFCNKMNDFAVSIGMTSSSFTTPDGWDDDYQYSTAADLIKLGEYVLSVPELRDIVNTSSTTIISDSGKQFSWTNSNELIDPYSTYYCPEIIGLKTGTTEYAGNSLLSAFIVDDKTYIALAAGCYYDAGRYELTIELLRAVQNGFKAKQN